MAQPNEPRVSVDAVLDAARRGEAAPSDARQWIVIEVRDGQQFLTVHNFDAQTASGLLAWAQHHELHQIEGAEHAH